MVIKNAKLTSITLLTITSLIFFSSSLVSVIRISNKQLSPVYLEHKWNVSKNNTNAEIVSISEYDFSSLKKNESLTIVHQLPFTTETFPVLVLKTKNCNVQAEISGKTVYSKTLNTKNYDYFLNWDTNLIPLNESKKDDVITITLTATTDKPFKIILTPFVTPAAQYTEDYMKNNIFVFFLICFLFLFGIIAAMISIVSFFFRITMPKLFSVSLFAMTASIFIFVKYDFVQLFSFSPQLINNLDIYSRWLGALSFIFVVYMHFTINLDNKINIQLLATTIISLLMIFMYALKIIPMPVLSIIWKIVSRILIIMVLFYSIRHFIKASFKSSIMAVNCIVVVVFSFIDFMKYLAFKATIGHRAFFSYTNTAVAFTLFTFISLLNYFFNSAKNEFLSQSSLSYKNNAIFDFLTATYSRSKILEILSEKDNSHTDYSLLTISFLPSKHKNQNDIQNQLIFIAKQISSFFEMCGIIGRINETQFIAVLPKEPENTIKNLITTFQKKLDEENASTLFPVKTLIGWANSDETGTFSYEAVYNLAEERRKEFTDTGENL